jgi:DNA-binding transcriptional LysR family regulator
MELRHLRYFVAVAESLNFTKAAARLRVAQPALSRQIRDLEEELGAPLLERGPRSVRLTEAGAVFQPEAKSVLQRAEAATKAVQAVARGERGEIHVGYAPSPTVELLPCTLHAFQNVAPEVRVTLHDLSSEEMLRGLGDGAPPARPGSSPRRAGGR